MFSAKTLKAFRAPPIPVQTKDQVHSLLPPAVVHLYVNEIRRDMDPAATSKERHFAIVDVISKSNHND